MTHYEDAGFVQKPHYFRGTKLNFELLIKNEVTPNSAASLAVCQFFYLNTSLFEEASDTEIRGLFSMYGPLRFFVRNAKVCCASFKTLEAAEAFNAHEDHMLRGSKCNFAMFEYPESEYARRIVEIEAYLKGVEINASAGESETNTEDSQEQEVSLQVNR